MELIEFEKRRDIGDLISVTFNFLKSEMKLFFKPLLLILIPFSLIVSLVSTLSAMGSFEALREMNFENNNIGYSIILGFLTFLWYLISTAYSIGYIKAYIRHNGQLNQELISEEIKSYAKKISLAYLASVLSIILISIILISLNVALFYAGIVFAIAITAPVSIVILIYLSNILILVTPIASFEGDIKNAFKRAFTLIKNYWWFTFGALLLMVIISSAVIAIFSVPVYVYTIMKGIVYGTTQQLDVNPVLLYVASFISNLGIIGSVFTVVMLVFHYFNLITRKENPELMNRIDQLGTDTETA
ncbi:MAG: hypothetical protein ACOCZW_00860 [Bacteroidota bacterium]